MNFDEKVLDSSITIANQEEYENLKGNVFHQFLNICINEIEKDSQEYELEEDSGDEEIPEEEQAPQEQYVIPPPEDVIQDAVEETNGNKMETPVVSIMISEDLFKKPKKPAKKEESKDTQDIKEEHKVIQSEETIIEEYDEDERETLECRYFQYFDRTPRKPQLKEAVYNLASLFKKVNPEIKKNIMECYK